MFEFVFYKWSPMEQWRTCRRLKAPAPAGVPPPASCYRPRTRSPRLVLVLLTPCAFPVFPAPSPPSNCCGLLSCARGPRQVVRWGQVSVRWGVPRYFGARHSNGCPHHDLWVSPRPHECWYAQGRNIRQQIKIIVKGRERNPRGNGKALYLDL